MLQFLTVEASLQLVGAQRRSRLDGAAEKLPPVVIYREPSTTEEMRYHRFSQRVNNVAIFLSFWMSLPVNS